MEVTRFERRADWDRAGNVCGFWRKVRFSECASSPASELTMIIVGVWGWALHRASNSAVKQCLPRLSPKLPNAALLKLWYLRHTRGDFTLTSSQKTYSACFSSFLAFWTSCAEGWRNLSEGGRQKMCMALKAIITGRWKDMFFPFITAFQDSKICCNKTRLW